MAVIVMSLVIVGGRGLLHMGAPSGGRLLRLLGLGRSLRCLVAHFGPPCVRCLFSVLASGVAAWLADGPRRLGMPQRVAGPVPRSDPRDPVSLERAASGVVDRNRPPWPPQPAATEGSAGQEWSPGPDIASSPQYGQSHRCRSMGETSARHRWFATVGGSTWMIRDLERANSRGC